MARNVGVIGLGIMGGAMASNLAQAGFKVSGFDVDAAAIAALRRKRGAPLASAGAVARAAPIVITSLPSTGALIAVAEEIAASGARGRVVIETSTLPIEVKERARAMLERAGITLLDAPLSGTGAQARTRDLAVYASGPPAAYKRAIPVFKGFARAWYHVGPFGAGSKMKFVANHLVAIHNVAAAEALVLAAKAGLDPELAYRVIADGAGSSRMFQVRGPMMVAGEYSEATMKVEVWQKDMTIIGDFVRALQCPTPLFAASAPIYDAAMAQGHAKDDTASVCAVIGKMANLRRRAGKRR